MIMRASAASEVENVGIFCYFFQYFVGTFDMLLSFLHTKSAISFNILSVQMICLWYGGVALYNKR